MGKRIRTSSGSSGVELAVASANGRTVVLAQGDQEVDHHDRVGMPTSPIPGLVSERETTASSSPAVWPGQATPGSENDADSSASCFMPLMVLALLVLLNAVVFGSFPFTSLFAEPVPAELPCCMPLFPMPCH